MNTPAELTAELLRLSKRLDAAQEELVKASNLWANCERDYRRSRWLAFQGVQGEKMTVPEREAKVDYVTADDRLRRDQAEGQRQAWTEANRNYRQQISALQSIAAATRSEAELAGKYTAA